MKKWNPYLVVLLSWITVGIFNLFWFYFTRKEMVKKGAEIPPYWWIFLPLLLIFGAAWAIIFHFVWLPNHHTSAALTNAVNSLSLILGLAGLVGMPLAIYWFWKFCGGIEKLTIGDWYKQYTTRKKTRQGGLSQSSAFWLFIGLVILQNVVSGSLSGGRNQVVGWMPGIIGAAWFGIVQNSLNKVK